MTSDGQPYGPIRYNEIVKERYYISKYCNTSYKDVGEMSPIERQCVLKLIEDELLKQKEMYEKAEREMKNR